MLQVVADAGFTLQTKGEDSIDVVPSSNKHSHVITDEEDNNCQIARVRGINLGLRSVGL